MTSQNPNPATRRGPAALDLGGAVEALKAAGHPVRFRTLAMLREGPLCVCQIASALGLPASTVSGYLSDLRRARLVAETRRGKWVHYRLAGDAARARLARELFRLTAEDQQIRHDARVVAKLRRIPVGDLCRAGLDLTAIGVRPGRKHERARRGDPRHV